MKKSLWLLAVVPALLLANESGHEGSTDIIPRTVNFLIFAGLAYYLLADKIKGFFTQRSASIAAEFESAQAKLRDSLSVKEEAANALEESKKTAQDVLKSCDHEAELLVKRIEDMASRDGESLEKHAQEAMVNQKRKLLQTTVTEVLNEAIVVSDVTLTPSDLANKLQGKVA